MLNVIYVIMNILRWASCFLDIFALRIKNYPTARRFQVLRFSGMIGTIGCKAYTKLIWVVVKIMVPLWVP